MNSKHIAALSFLLLSSHEIHAQAEPSQNGLALRDYIRNLKYNPFTLLAVQGDGTVRIDDNLLGEPTESGDEDNSGKITTCTRTTHSLKSNFDNIAIVQPTQGVIYPGALIKVNRAMLDGKPEAIQNLRRGPLTLRLKLPGLGDEGNLRIEEPSDGTVESAINRALDVWTSQNDTPESYKNASRSNYEVTEAYSSDQLAVKLGAAVGYMAFSGSAAFSVNSSSEKRIITAIYKQVFYTVSFDPPNGFTTEQFFHPSVTVEQAKQEFSDEAPLAYVASEDIGRLLMFKMEVSKSVSSLEAEAALKYGVAGFSVGVETKSKYEKILENSTINVITLGGNAAVSSQANSAKGVADLKNIIQGENAIFSRNNPGSAIGYTIKFVKDNSIAKLGSTTEYTATECNSFDSRWIRVENRGAFILDKFILTYDTPERFRECKLKPPAGTPAWNGWTRRCDRNSNEYQPVVTLEHGGGGAWKWFVPGDATNVLLRANVVAGYQRKKWLDDPNKDFNVCYITKGTTLIYSKDFEVVLPGMDGCY
jgi:thiol-activated cytolysin